MRGLSYVALAVFWHVIADVASMTEVCEVCGQHIPFK